MAPFAWQSNKSYPFLLHLKLCLHLCILHQWTEAKFQQQCVWEECLSGAVLFICQAHSVCRMVQVTTLSVQRPWDFAAAKEWSISSYQAVPKVGSVVCFFFFTRGYEWHAMHGMLQDTWVRKQVPDYLASMPSMYHLEGRSDLVHPLKIGSKI